MTRRNQSLYELIREHNDGNPDTTAEAVWRATRCPEKWRELFFPLVRDECRRRIRGVVRFLERRPNQREEARPMSKTRDGAPPRLVGAETRRMFLDERFYTGDKYVTHGAATIEDHEGRIAFQFELRGGIDVDIAFHRAAIELITRTGVTCLNEVPDADLDGLAA